MGREYHATSFFAQSELISCWHLLESITVTANVARNKAPCYCRRKYSSQLLMTPVCIYSANLSCTAVIIRSPQLLPETQGGRHPFRVCPHLGLFVCLFPNGFVFCFTR